jgi:hypothetical protein
LCFSTSVICYVSEEPECPPEQKGPVVYYVLFFINIEFRRVHIAGMMPKPDAIRMAQQARNLSMFFAEQGQAGVYYLRVA